MGGVNIETIRGGKVIIEPKLDPKPLKRPEFNLSPLKHWLRNLDLMHGSLASLTRKLKPD